MPMCYLVPNVRGRKGGSIKHHHIEWQLKLRICQRKSKEKKKKKNRKNDYPGASDVEGGRNMEGAGVTNKEKNVVSKSKKCSWGNQPVA